MLSTNVVSAKAARPSGPGSAIGLGTNDTSCRGAAAPDGSNRSSAREVRRVDTDEASILAPPLRWARVARPTGGLRLVIPVTSASGTSPVRNRTNRVRSRTTARRGPRRDRRGAATLLSVAHGRLGADARLRAHVELVERSLRAALAA